MKKTLSLILALAMCLSLCACGGATTQHTHEWMVANCTTPKTCSTCGETEGSATGHNWKAATCTTAKTCSTCGETEGSATGHNWKATTCTTAKTCSACGEIEGSATGHNWKAATCTTAKTCSTCGETEGSATGHNWKAATCTTAKTCLACGEIEGTVIEHNYKDGECTMCGIEDPAVEQILNAKAAYAMLLVAEGYCDMFSSMIADAWYFAIYKSDNYYKGDSAIAAFSSYVGIEKDLVTAGVDSYLTSIGYSIDSSSRCAVLRTNSGALYVVHYALSKNDGFKNAKECLDSAKEYTGQLDINYASVNARSELIAYYSAVSAYYDFCYSPSGSYSTLSSTLNGFRTNCTNNRTLCSFYFD